MKHIEFNVKKKYPSTSINPIVKLPELIQAIKLEKEKITNNKILNKSAEKPHYIMKDKDGSYIM